MTPEERTRIFELQTAQSYALLGEFISGFELVVHTLRASLETGIGDGMYQFDIQDLTVSLTAAPLLLAFRSFCNRRSNENPIALRAIAEFGSAFQKMIELRNDLSHGTHYIGWSSEDEHDFTNPTIMRLKPAANGAKVKPMNISHDFMAEKIAELKLLNQTATVMAVMTQINRWEQNFDYEGKLIL